MATQEGSEDGCIFKVLCKKGTFLSLVGRINDTEQKTTPSLNSSTVKGQSCVCTAVGSMSLTPTAPIILYYSPVKVGHAVSTSRSVCDYFITLPLDNDRFHSAAVGVVSSSLTRARYTWQKTKSGTNDLTPPVNSDFSQPVITCSANSCD